MSSYEVVAVLIFTFLSYVGGQENEGDNCIIAESKLPGVCRIIGDCTTAIEEAAYYAIMPQVCFYKGSLAVVCCPNSSPHRTSCLRLPDGMVNVPNTGSKATNYCNSLPERIYPCLRTETGFTRGNICPLALDTTVPFGPDTPTSKREIPHLATLGGIGDTAEQFTWWCVGSLVSDRFVLGAVYCFEGWSTDLTRVKLGGESNTRSNSSLQMTAQVYNVIRKIPHPQYNSNIGQYNDIGLLQLDRAVIFTSRILPACLHTGTPFSDTELVLTGGKAVTNEDGSELFKWSVREISHTECGGESRNDDVPDGIKNTSQICSRPRATGNNCWYDRVGPLQVFNGRSVACTTLLVGVGSYSRSCQLHVATRVAPYVSWIEKIVWP